MTAARMIVLSCDHDDCEEQTDALEGDEDDARRDAADQGWVAIEDFDYCPEHAEEVQPFQCQECEWVFIEFPGSGPHSCPGCDHPETKPVEWEYEGAE